MEVSAYMQKNVLQVSLLDVDGKNRRDFYCADVIGSKKFAVNYAGYPRSDISLINEQTNVAVAKSMLQSLNDYHSDSNPTAGMSDDEIMLSHMSKYQQTYSECARYVENQLGIVRRRSAESDVQPAVETKIDFSENKESTAVS